VVAAACVVLPWACLAAPIRDSKQTTEEEREAAFEELTHSPGKNIPYTRFESVLAQIF
jgi:ribonuclease HII